MSKPALERNSGQDSSSDPNPPRIEAAVLLGDSREVILVHKEFEYRLRLTSNDKLILTK